MKKFLVLFLLLAISITGIRIAKADDSSDFDIQDGVLVKFNGKGGDVIIPGNVTSIGGFAFDGCKKLTSIEISNSVTSIGSCAFRGCEGLKSVTIPSSVISIGESAFGSCNNIESVIINEGVTNIGDHAFAYCRLTDGIVIPKSATNIGERIVEYNAGIQKIIYLYANSYAESVLKESGIELRYLDVNGNKYKIIESGNLREFIGVSSDVIIPENTVDIYASAFASNRLIKNVVIPNGAKWIESGAFLKCRNLKSVTIPESVTYIGEEAFDGCPYDMVIYGVIGSYAEQYAEEYNIRFVSSDPLTYEIAGFDIEISDRINLDFYYAISEQDVISGDVYAKVSYADGHIERKNFDVNKNRSYGENTYYAIDCLLAAKEMNDTVTVQLWSNTTNQACSKKCLYSIREYCNDLLAHGTASVAEENLVNAMLTYGAYSQIYFDYNRNKIAPIDDTETLEQKILRTEAVLNTIPVEEYSGELPSGLMLYGYSLVLESTIGYRLYFHIDDAGLAKKYGLISADEEGLYYTELFSVSAADLGSLFEFKVEAAVIRSCPLFYVSLAFGEEASTELKQLCVSVVDYYEAVLDYAVYMEGNNHQENNTDILH